MYFEFAESKLGLFSSINKKRELDLTNIAADT